MSMGDDVETLSCILSGVAVGLIFYIPGRLREHFQIGWFMTIVISIIFMYALIWLSGIIGNIVYLIILFPFVDIGFSVYKLVKAGKNMQMLYVKEEKHEKV